MKTLKLGYMKKSLTMMVGLGLLGVSISPALADGPVIYKTEDLRTAAYALAIEEIANYYRVVGH